MSKTLIWFGLFVGSTAGGYAPCLFGADELSVWTIIGGSIGGLAGIIAGYKLAARWNL